MSYRISFLPNRIGGDACEWVIPEGASDDEVREVFKAFGNGCSRPLKVFVNGRDDPRYRLFKELMEELWAEGVDWQVYEREDIDELMERRKSWA